MTKQIEELRRELKVEVDEAENDFLQSSVLRLSRRLDKKITAKMKKKFS